MEAWGVFDKNDKLLAAYPDQYEAKQHAQSYEHEFKTSCEIHLLDIDYADQGLAVRKAFRR